MSRCLRLWVGLLAAWVCSTARAQVYKPEPLPLLLPDGAQGGARPGPGKLAVAKQGMAFLASLGACIAPVVVIGPYRSGKSFTLDQLLQVDCEHGFGVGHTRSTQTRGIWVWGEPQPLTLPDGSTCQVVYVDTEGFESTGRGTAYDDRIFTISTLLSSLLIYNLPEAIRESDIAKLSFAVQLAEGLFSRHEAGPAADGTDSAGTLALPPSAADDAVPLSGSFEPGAMLWLIQRDFLQGSAAQQAVEQALAKVPNPSGSEEVASLNRVRASLSHLTATSTGFSLPQPHLQRAQLCALPDDQLDPGYRKAREELRSLVKKLVRPKVVGGHRATGASLANLITQLVDALNQQEIPSVVNLLDTFNKQQVWKAVARFRKALQVLHLPMDTQELAGRYLSLRDSTVASVGQALLGNRHASGLQTEGVESLMAELRKALDREYHVRETENEVASNRLCGQLEAHCESQFDVAVQQRMPSLRLFLAATQHCLVKFNSTCVGPARDEFWVRLARAQERSEEAFRVDYNERLYTGLLMLLIACGCAFRFVIRIRVLEILCWLGSASLTLAPHLTLGGASQMYSSPWWRITVHVWEVIMLLLRLDTWWAPCLWICCIIAISVWRYRRRPQSTLKPRTIRPSSAGIRRAPRELDV